MRIKNDLIRYKDKYTVSLRGDTVHVEWYSSGNTWTPGDEAVTVSGYPSFQGDSAMDDRIALLEMIAYAIVLKHNPEFMEFPEFFGTKRERYQALRTWIDERKEVLR